jgi:hypothetical protein
MDNVIATMSAGEGGVRSEIVGAFGRILLDRPRALNALNLAMVKLFRAELERFAEDPKVRCVTVSSTRPGTFCAGGDVRVIRRARLEGRHAEADAFFEHEFDLNARISQYPKIATSDWRKICSSPAKGSTAIKQRGNAKGRKVPFTFSIRQPKPPPDSAY